MTNRALTIAAVILIAWAVVRHTDRHLLGPRFVFAHSGSGFHNVCDDRLDANIEHAVDSSLSGLDNIALDFDDDDFDVHIDVDGIHPVDRVERERLREQLRERIRFAREHARESRDQFRHAFDDSRRERDQVREELRSNIRSARDQWREDIRQPVREMRERRTELRNEIRERRDEIRKEIRRAIREAKENSEIY
jgi:vacuolar-type H+-ATPase subunit H